MIKYIVLSAALFIFLTGFSQRKPDKTGNQRAYYECSDPFAIDSSLFVPKNGKIYFHFDTETSPSNEEFKQFLWYDNNKSTDYFTAYLVNTSDSSFHATRQDGSLIMIQEALDEKGKWTPIEYWVYSGCGNSYFDPLDLEPGKCVMVPIKKYSGNFATKIRLRFEQGERIYYSESFDGNINKSQFAEETGNVDGILYHGRANYLENAEGTEPTELK